LALIHCRMVMPGRVEMRAVVSCQLHTLDRPSMSVRQVFLLEAGKERQDLRQTLLMIDVLDPRIMPRRVGHNVVPQRRRNVDEASSHVSLPAFPCAPAGRAAIIRSVPPGARGEIRSPRARPANPASAGARKAKPARPP